MVLITVKVGSRKWQAEATRVDKLTKELDKIRDKLYYNHYLKGSREAISGINEVKKLIRFYAKMKNYSLTWITEIEITPKHVYLWYDGPLREVDLEAIIYAFKGNEISVTSSTMRNADFLVKVW